MGVMGSDLLAPPAGSCVSTTPIPSSMPTFVRPGADEYAPYYERYVSLVPDGDLLASLTRLGERPERAVREHLSGDLDQGLVKT